MRAEVSFLDLRSVIVLQTEAERVCCVVVLVVFLLTSLGPVYHSTCILVVIAWVWFILFV